MLLFSIIIPVFNRSLLVCSTLDSIKNQIFKDFEVILVDDGSTDDLKNHLLTYIASGEINYQYQKNAGVSSARNFGATFSQAQYLIFLDSDDSVTNTWLLDFATSILKINSDIVYCGINRFIDNVLVEYTNPSNPYRDGKSIGIFLAGSFCIKRRLFKNLGGYDERLTYGENTELGFRIKQANPTMAFISSPNLIYNLHENSHGKNTENKMNSLIYTINKHSQLFNDNNDLKGKFLSIAGVCAVSINENKKAREYFWEAWKLSPFNFIMLLRLLFSFSPFISKKIWDNR